MGGSSEDTRRRRNRRLLAQTMNPKPKGRAWSRGLGGEASSGLLGSRKRRAIPSVGLPLTARRRILIFQLAS